MAESIDTYSFEKDFGGVVFITIDNIQPDTERAIKMRIGTLTDISIHKTSYNRAYTPVSECKDLDLFDFNKIFYDIIISSNYSYSQSQCFDVCLQHKIISACNCYSVEYLYLANSVKPCLNKTEIKCSKKAYYDFIESDIKESCESYCPLECSYNDLELIVSTSSFPSTEYGDLIKNFDSVKKQFSSIYHIPNLDLLSTILAVNIYFNDLEYTLIEETEKNDIVDLVANIGGTIGVFIGISILSFAEMIEFLIEIGFILFKKRSILNEY